MVIAIYKANEIVYNHTLFSIINDLGARAVPEDLNANDIVLNLILIIMPTTKWFSQATNRFSGYSWKYIS